MTTEPIVPAAPLARNHDGVPWSAEYADVYHPAGGPFMQARHVFLAGNGLPARWHGRDRFVVLETGFGLGNNFLATWDAWRRDPARSLQLCFISIERHPLRRGDLAAVHADSPLQALARQLVAAWPPLTPNLHRLSFEAGQVQLLLALGDVQAWLPQIVAQVDAFYLDGHAPARNPAMWSARVLKALGRLAAPQATVATWTAAQAVHAGLTTAGFEVRLAPGIAGKRDITLARYAPRFVPRHAPARQATVPPDRHALIVGAGLAGCATAWALAEHGWSSTLIERGPGIAGAASGNIAGLFHGIVNRQDGAHARFNRAAAAQAQLAVHTAITRHSVPGSTDGLLRLETGGDVDDMRAVLTQLGLPLDYVQALDAASASAMCGIPLAQPAWFYPGGGWVEPAGLARAYLERAGERASVRCGVEVAAIEPQEGQWRLLDARGGLIAQAGTLVIANADGAPRLLGGRPWPIERVRGQISLAPRLDESVPPLPLPRLPIAGAGYLLPPVGDQVVFGATAQPGDEDARVRDDDHRHNLAQLERLTGRRWPWQPDDLKGRTAWRFVADDRLPVIGAVADEAAFASSSRLDQPRFVPRRPGLFVHTALGSRGITWSALGAQVLAACVTGAPVPLEADLLDAVDPARFIVRALRRRTRTS